MFIKTMLLVTMCLSFACAQERYMESYLLLQETLGNCAKIVEVSRTNDLEVVKIEIDLVGSTPKVTLKSMSTDFTYAIFAQGSTSRIADLDIEVYAADGVTLIKKDDGNSALAMVSFTPPEAGYYIIKIIVAKMVSGYEGSMGQFCLVVTHN